MTGGGTGNGVPTTSYVPFGGGGGGLGAGSRSAAPVSSGAIFAGVVFGLVGVVLGAGATFIA